MIDHAGRFADSQRVSTAAKQLRRQLGDDADHPAYILTDPRFRYRMTKAEGAGSREGLTKRQPRDLAKCRCSQLTLSPTAHVYLSFWCRLDNRYLHPSWAVAKKRCGTRGRWVWIQLARGNSRQPTCDSPV